MCPELTVDKVMMQVKEQNQVMAYLPDLPKNGKLYVERDFLFAIVNTRDICWNCKLKCVNRAESFNFIAK